MQARIARIGGARRVIRPLCPVLFLLVLGSVSASRHGDGLAAFKAGKYDEALSHFQHEVRTKPDAPEPLANLGATLSRLGRHDDALRVLDEALTLAPGPRVEAAIRYDIGNALLALDRVDEAVEAYKASLRLNPGDREARINLELALRRQKPKPPPPPAPDGAGARQPPRDGNSGAAPPQKQNALPDTPRLTREEAERLLDAVQRRERLAFPKRRPRAGEVVERDW